MCQKIGKTKQDRGLLKCINLIFEIYIISHRENFYQSPTSGRKAMSFTT